jgi:hypothetical protein
LTVIRLFDNADIAVAVRVSPGENVGRTAIMLLC